MKAAFLTPSEVTGKLVFLVQDSSLQPPFTQIKKKKVS